MAQLNKEQIREIKQFIHSRGFTHIEIEMEILDHVASAVEDKLSKGPKKSLDKVIQEVHSSFGVFGFASIEEEKQKFFVKKIRDQYWNVFTGFLLSKSFLITLLIASLYALIIGLFQQFEHKIIRFGPFIVMTLLTVSYLLLYHWRYRKLHKKSLMMSNIYVLFLFLQPNFGNFLGTLLEGYVESGGQYVIGLFTFGMTVLTLLLLSLKSTMDWAYKWTYERYLKYETSP